MTSDRVAAAAKVIAKYANTDMGGDYATYLARALADAGLLAPDLPPMTGVCWWRTGNTRIDVTDESAVDPRIERKNYTPERARKIALALLAAADYAEGEGA